MSERAMEGQGRAEQMRAMLAVGGSLSRSIAAMQAAWIEWRYGRGADAAMQWIENTLIGPGLIPGDDESDAQAFFDRAIAEIENHQIRHAAALRSDAQGEDRWEDVAFGPVTEAYNEAHAARRDGAQGDAALKHAMDNGFVRGVLHATEHVYEYGGSTHADELIEDLVDSFGPARVQGVARENGLSHSQRAAIEVARRLRAARLGEGGGE